MAITLNVHGDTQYESVVGERLAKYEQMMKEAIESEAHHHLLSGEKADENGRPIDDDNLLLDDGHHQLVQTNYLLPNSDEITLLQVSAPDKTIDAHPVALLEERKEVDDSSLLHCSMVDVQKDQDFAIAVDPSLIVVKNMEQ